ncbi:hypothetical protein Q8A73_012847 [Channa argus]|nr:hypothetical protein Q8A73_012847 [Channa argus]
MPQQHPAKDRRTSGWENADEAKRMEQNQNARACCSISCVLECFLAATLNCYLVRVEQNHCCWSPLMLLPNTPLEVGGVRVINFQSQRKHNDASAPPSHGHSRFQTSKEKQGSPEVLATCSSYPSFSPRAWGFAPQASQSLQGWRMGVFRIFAPGRRLPSGLISNKRAQAKVNMGGSGETTSLVRTRTANALTDLVSDNHYIKDTFSYVDQEQSCLLQAIFDSQETFIPSSPDAAPPLLRAAPSLFCSKPFSGFYEGSTGEASCLGSTAIDWIYRLEDTKK